MKIDKKVGTYLTIYDSEGRMIDHLFDGFKSIKQIRQYIELRLRDTGHRKVSVSVSQDGDYFKSFALRIRKA